MDIDEDLVVDLQNHLLPVELESKFFSSIACDQDDDLKDLKDRPKGLMSLDPAIDCSLLKPLLIGGSESQDLHTLAAENTSAFLEDLKIIYELFGCELPLVEYDSSGEDTPYTSSTPCVSAPSSPCSVLASPWETPVSSPQSDSSDIDVETVPPSPDYVTPLKPVPQGVKRTRGRPRRTVSVMTPPSEDSVDSCVQTTNLSALPGYVGHHDYHRKQDFGIVESVRKVSISSHYYRRKSSHSLSSPEKQKRYMHNELERKRRDGLKKLQLNLLEVVVQGSEVDVKNKLSKKMILHCAELCIRKLIKESALLEQEKQRLSETNRTLREHVRTLEGKTPLETIKKEVME